VYEEDEVFNVSLVNVSGGGHIGSLSTTQVTITDDGDAGTFEFSSSTFRGSEDAGTIAVTVTRVGGASGRVTVDYHTLDDIALVGEDYVQTTGFLIFEDGETRRSFRVRIVNDSIFEFPDESFAVVLSNPTNGSRIDEFGSTGSVIITDDGDAGTFSFAHAVYTIGEDRGHVDISVSRIGGTSTIVSVGYYTTDGDAKAGSDYVNVQDILTFDEGEEVKTFRVQIIDDVEYEFPYETFNVVLENATAGSLLGNDITAEVSINDERDVKKCETHTSKSECAGTGPQGICCIWIATGTNGSGVCSGAAPEGLLEMLCRNRVPQ
jgi:hypothetical protein